MWPQRLRNLTPRRRLMGCRCCEMKPAYYPRITPGFSLSFLTVETLCFDHQSPVLTFIRFFLVAGCFYSLIFILILEQRKTLLTSTELKHRWQNIQDGNFYTSNKSPA